jgi:hypothetical protein
LGNDYVDQFVDFRAPAVNWCVQSKHLKEASGHKAAFIAEGNANGQAADVCLGTFIFCSNDQAFSVA